MLTCNKTNPPKLFEFNPIFVVKIWSKGKLLRSWENPDQILTNFCPQCYYTKFFSIMIKDSVLNANIVSWIDSVIQYKIMEWSWILKFPTYPNYLGWL